MDSKESHANLHGIAPQFLVRDVREAAEYYRDRFGFKIGPYFEDPPAFVIVERDDQRIMLSRMEGTRGGSNRTYKHVAIDAYVWTKDVDRLRAEFEARGAKLLGPPCDQSYGLREIQVADLDGYIICFGAPIASR